MGGCYGSVSPKRNKIAQPTFRYELNPSSVASLLSLKAAASS